MVKIGGAVEKAKVAYVPEENYRGTRTYTPRPKKPTLSKAFWIAYEDVMPSVESAFAKWPSKLASVEIMKLELEGLR